MAMADGNGLPIAIGIAGGPRHEAPLALETLGNRFVRGQLVRLIGDKAYDSKPLEKALDKRGIALLAPLRGGIRATRSRKLDGRVMRRYKHRWLIERFFSWLMRWRRLVTRYEHKAENFLGFVELATALILLRRF
jgi:transposase